MDTQPYGNQRGNKVKGRYNNLELIRLAQTKG